MGDPGAIPVARFALGVTELEMDRNFLWRLLGVAALAGCAGCGSCGGGKADASGAPAAVDAEAAVRPSSSDALDAAVTRTLPAGLDPSALREPIPAAKQIREMRERKK